MSTLSAAVKALEASELVRALELLADAWREVPDPRLGACIVTLGDLVAPRLSGPWEATAKQLRAEHLSALLATVQGPSKVMKERVLLLQAWPADPRLDRWVARQYEKPPFTSTGSGPFWTALKKLTRRLSDPVARATLSTLTSERLEGVTVEPPKATTTLPPEAVADLDALEAAIARRQTPTTGQRTAADLLADVLANPSDLTVRHVLMDALLEQGHPRGQLLALQLKAGALTAAEKKQEKALITQHWAELLGPLAPALKPDSRFARGFLVHAEGRAATSSAVDNAIAQAKGHPLWRTVESFCGDGRLLSGGEFPCLRAVETWRCSLAELARFTALESLTMRLTEGDLAVLTRPGAFPALHTMGLILPLDLLAPFEAWASGRSWRSLTFNAEPMHVPTYAPFLGGPLARATPHLLIRVQQADFARCSMEVQQAGGKTAVTLRLELAKGIHPTYSERVVADALRLFEAVADRPGLVAEVVPKNVTDGPRAQLMERVQSARA
jgi:uncharacterized protein (TIGR02996 family)